MLSCLSSCPHTSSWKASPFEGPGCGSVLGALLTFAGTRWPVAHTSGLQRASHIPPACPVPAMQSAFLVLNLPFPGPTPLTTPGPGGNGWLGTGPRLGGDRAGWLHAEEGGPEVRHVDLSLWPRLCFYRGDLGLWPLRTRLPSFNLHPARPQMVPLAWAFLCSSGLGLKVGTAHLTARQVSSRIERSGAGDRWPSLWQPRSSRPPTGVAPPFIGSADTPSTCGEAPCPQRVTLKDLVCPGWPQDPQGCAPAPR